MKHESIVWMVTLGAPLIWLASFGTNFALAPLACATQSKAALWVVSILALALVGLCGAVALAQWREVRAHADPSCAAIGRVAAGGAVLSAMFFAVIFAQAIPNLILTECQ